MIEFTMTNSRYTQEDLGYVPSLLSERDPRNAAVQLDANYQHGVSFEHFSGFTPSFEGEVADWYLKYPGDPHMKAVAYYQLRDETVVVFEDAWVAVVQPDKSYVLSRMD